MRRSDRSSNWLGAVLTAGFVAGVILVLCVLPCALMTAAMNYLPSPWDWIAIVVILVLDAWAIRAFFRAGSIQSK